MKYIDEIVKVKKLQGKTLYHYTGQGAIKSIIETNIIWATKSDCLNDRSEFLYGFEVAKQCSFDKIKDTEFKKDLFAALDKAVSFEELNESFYLISFSKKQDNLILWSEFAEGKGACMGVDYAKFSNMLPMERYWDGEVIYSRNKQEELLDEVIDSILDEMKVITNTDLFAEKIVCRGVSRNELIKNLVSWLVEPLLVYSMFMKRPEFKSEHEYRFVFSPKDFKGEKPEIKFNKKDQAIIPYIEISGNIRGALKSITIAPTNMNELAEKGMRYFLKAYGIKAEVEKSKIPLR